VLAQVDVMEEGNKQKISGKKVDILMTKQKRQLKEGRFKAIEYFAEIREQRNDGLKYESDCVRIGIGIKIFMNHGRFCKRSFC
jgi:hypothetical protein